MTKEKKTSIRMLDACMTRLANSTECIAPFIEYFKNFESSSLILQSLVQSVLIYGSTTKKKGNQRGEYSLHVPFRC